MNREIESLQELNHPNVVKVLEYTYSISQDQRVHHILEEFVEGKDLSAVLRDGPLGLAAAKGSFLSLLSGLEAIAARQIVHRDLKPANVRVRPDGAPVIIDFGLARRLRDPDLTNTADGAAIGTPAYFAPEQFRGDKRDIDPRTDLFAVGILAYEAVLGRHPFYRPGMSYPEIEEAICDSDAPLQSEDFEALPDIWQLLIRRLLAKNRAGRPASPTHARAILEKAEEESE